MKGVRQIDTRHQIGRRRAPALAGMELLLLGHHQAGDLLDAERGAPTSVAAAVAARSRGFSGQTDHGGREPARIDVSSAAW